MQLTDSGFTHRNPQATSNLFIPIGLVPTVTREESVANLLSNLRLDIEWTTECLPHDKEAIICGSAPSITNFIETIRNRRRDGSVIFACNSAAMYLSEYSLSSDYQVILDPSEDAISDFHVGAEKHLLASIVSPKIFKKANNPVLWHPLIDWVSKEVEEIERDFAYIGGGITVTMSAICLAYTMGYRRIRLYGADSSYTDGRHYVNDANPKDRLHVSVEHNGKTYETTYDMKQQVIVFMELVKQLKQQGCAIEVIGTGLLPDVFYDANSTT